MSRYTVKFAGPGGTYTLDAPSGHQATVEAVVIWCQDNPDQFDQGLSPRFLEVGTGAEPDVTVGQDYDECAECEAAWPH